MGEKMDRKYKGVIVKNDGTPVPPEEWIVFRAKDLAVLPMLREYYQICKYELQCDSNHVNAITELILRVEKYQENHLCQRPTTLKEELVS